MGVHICIHAAGFSNQVPRTWDVLLRMLSLLLLFGRFVDPSGCGEPRDTEGYEGPGSCSFLRREKASLLEADVTFPCPTKTIGRFESWGLALGVFFHFSPFVALNLFVNLGCGLLADHHIAFCLFPLSTPNRKCSRATTQLKAGTGGIPCPHWQCPPNAVTVGSCSKLLIQQQRATGREAGTLITEFQSERGRC